jgi:hypothetical protein
MAHILTDDELSASALNPLRAPSGQSPQIPLEDWQMQLMLLEQQNQKRLLMAQPKPPVGFSILVVFSSLITISATSCLVR